jgi:hypothetical protein
MKIIRIIKIIPILLIISLFTIPNLSAQGNFEFNFHYGTWSLNLLKSLAEEGIDDALGSELEDRILEEIQDDYPGLQRTSYSQEIEFDSSGENYGFEIRWYPGGKTGSFSLGLSIEKTRMTVTLPTVTAEMVLQDPVSQQTGTFRGSASGTKFEINPLSFHLSFRWDIKPSWKVHPYFTLGFGFATASAVEEGIVTYPYSGDLEINGGDSEHYEGREEKTLLEIKQELEDEGDEFFLPSFLPFFQMNFGIKAEFTEFLHLLVDAGIWNGFMLRGGLSLRF